MDAQHNWLSEFESDDSSLRIDQTAYMYSKDPELMTVTQQAMIYRHMWNDVYNLHKHFETLPENDENKGKANKLMNQLFTSFEE
jgi:hypothetical protein